MSQFRALPFFALAIGGTWLFWLVPTLARWPIWQAPGVWFLYVGGAAVPVAAAGLAWRHGQLADLLRRMMDPRLVPTTWWVAALLFIPLVHLAAAAVALLSGGQGDLFQPSPVLYMPAAELVSFTAFLLLLGPLPEEIGWRGYGLPALLNRFRPVAATFVLGVAWCVWHVPLLFMNGYYEPFGGAPDPAWFFLNILIISIFYTWIFLHTHGSVLAAVLFHFSVNFTGEVLPLSPEGESTKTAILMAIGTLLVALMLKMQRQRG